MRRNFLTLMVPLALAAPFELLSSRSSAQEPSPQKPHMPPPPQSAEKPFPIDIPKVESKEVLKHNQQEIRNDVERLYALAEELKEQVERTDSANVLSLHLVQKAEEIEKLAKQVKNLARG